MPTRKTFWIAATLAAIAFAEILFFFADYRGLIYDAYGYYVLSQRLIQGGLLAAAWPSRTYGYPLFVAICSGFQKVSPETARFLVFHVQLALLLGTAALGAKRIGQILRADRLVPVAYAAMVWNPFLLARATEALSDLLAGLLGFLAVLLTWKRDYPARPQSPPAAAAGSLLLAAAAVIIRPAAAAVLAAVAALWIARQWAWRELRPGVLPLVLAALALPFLPQLISNTRAFHRRSPLVVEGIYRDKVEKGIARLKYATAARPGEPPEIEYVNPFRRAEKTPGDLARRPLACAATLAAHLFGVLDQDFLFTDIRDLHPWYRWQLSAANFLFLLLGAVGAASALEEANRAVRRDPRRFALLSLLLAAGASLAIYLPVEAESRYAATFEIFWTPFVAVALLSIPEWWKEKRWKLLAGLSAGALLSLAVCLRVSAWLIAQAPRLR